MVTSSRCYSNNRPRRASNLGDETGFTAKSQGTQVDPNAKQGGFGCFNLLHSSLVRRYANENSWWMQILNVGGKLIGIIMWYLRVETEVITL
jgi:hypothetical protein